MSSQHRRQYDRRVNPLWWIAGAVTLIIVALALIWLVAGTETVLSWVGLGDDAQSEGADSGVNLSEVSDNPEAMYGQTVTVSGGVQEIVAPHAVTIGNDQILVGDSVLVVSAEDLPALLETQVGDEPDDMALQVTGIVRQFDLPAAEEETGVDLDDEALADHDGKSVIVAQEIEVNPPELGPGDTEQQGPSAGFEVNVDISAIVDDTETYVGETVTVSGEVERVITPNAFLFGDAMILAISAEGRDDLFVEPTAYIRGTVQVFDRLEIEELLGLDLDDEQFAEYEGEPVIIVEALELIK